MDAGPREILTITMLYQKFGRIHERHQQRTPDRLTKDKGTYTVPTCPNTEM